MNIGPFRLSGEFTDDHVEWLQELLTVDLPWHPLLAKFPKGLNIEVRDNILGGAYARYVNGTVMVRPNAGRSVLFHEIGHAYDRAALTREDREAVHVAMHDGDETAREHLTWDRLAIPQGADEPHGWVTSSNPHDARPGEAFAWWFAAHCGASHYTAYGRHSFTPQVARVVSNAARRVQMFSDVEPGSTHADAIHELAAAGIITGYEDGTFRPNEPVTRGQLATILSRQAKVG